MKLYLSLTFKLKKGLYKLFEAFRRLIKKLNKK